MSPQAITFDSAKVRDAVRSGAVSDADYLRGLKRAGIEFSEQVGQVQVLRDPAAQIEFGKDAQGKFTCDAQPNLVTVSNAGIPALPNPPARIWSRNMRARDRMGGEKATPKPAAGSEAARSSIPNDSWTFAANARPRSII